MAPSRSSMDAALEALYTEVPSVACRGLCEHSCTVIDASPRERQRMRQAGVTLPSRPEMRVRYESDPAYRCPALVEDRCSVYAIRPMICRLWGAVRGMRCPHGCSPAESPPSVDEAFDLVLRAQEAGWDRASCQAHREAVKARASDPLVRAALETFIGGGSPTGESRPSRSPRAVEEPGHLG